GSAPEGSLSCLHLCRIRETDGSGKQCCVVLYREICKRPVHIGSHFIRMAPGWLLGAYIASQRRRKGLVIARRNCLAVRLCAAVEHARKLFHPLGNPLVADTKLPQRMVDILEKLVGDILRQLNKCLRATARAFKKQEHMR